MVKQATAYDRLRTQYARMESDYERKLSGYEESTKKLNSLLRACRRELDSAVSVREHAFGEIATLKAHHSSLDPSRRLMSYDDHERMVSRMERETSNRVAIVEAEKGELILENSMLKIELVQAKNEIPENQELYSQPEALSQRLTEAVKTACLQSQIDCAFPNESLLTLSTVISETDHTRRVNSINDKHSFY